MTRYASTHAATGFPPSYGHCPPGGSDQAVLLTLCGYPAEGLSKREVCGFRLLAELKKAYV